MTIFDVVNIIKTTLESVNYTVIMFETTPIEIKQIPCVVFSDLTVEEDKSYAHSKSKAILSLGVLTTDLQSCFSETEEIKNIINTTNFEGFVAQVKEVRYTMKEEGEQFFAATLSIEVIFIV